MYLFILTNFFDNNNYYPISGKNYEEIKQFFPQVADLKCEDIESVVIYSLKENLDKNAKIAKCTSIEILDSILKVRYEETKQCSASCKDIKNRLYGNLIRNGVIHKNAQVPFLALVENINDYNYICNGSAKPKYTSKYKIIADLKKTQDWESIVADFPTCDDIEGSEYWDDAMALYDLAYALSKLCEKNKRKPNFLTQQENFFVKVIERCIVLQPKDKGYKSTRAYFYYLRYQKFKKTDDYNIAQQYYCEIINEFDKLIYKERQRYTHLRELHYDSHYKDMDNPKDFFEEINLDFIKLIDDYDSLDEREKKDCKKNYISAMYSFAKFNINNRLHYWNSYFAYKFQGKSIDYQFKKEQLQRIAKVDEVLTKIYNMRNYDSGRRDEVDENPNYFETAYRLSEIKMIEGIVYYLSEKSEYHKYFEESIGYVDELLKTFRELRKIRINNPGYAKEVKAKCLFFLQKYTECHNCFYKAPNYMLYTQAQIYTLCSEFDKAIDILEKIPQTDKCFEKAQKLIEEVNTKK